MCSTEAITPGTHTAAPTTARAKDYRNTVIAAFTVEAVFLKA
jgi:hypothetical protein